MIKRKHLLIIIFLVLIILFLFVFCSLINKHDVINKIIKKEENTYSYLINYPYFNNDKVDNYVDNYLSERINTIILDNGDLFIDYDYDIKDNNIFIKFYEYVTKLNTIKENIYEINYDYELDNIIKKRVFEEDNYDILNYTKSDKMVAFTFDDGPNPETTTPMLDALEENYAKATFFCLGQNAGYYPETVQREYNLGMEVGTHTYSHVVLTSLSASALDSEISKSVDAINKAIGVKPSLMRPPYGAVNKTVLSAVGGYNLCCMNWSLDTEDWKTKNADATYNEVMKAQDGDVVLLHDIHEYNVDAVKRFVPDLIAEGFQLVTVPELYEARGETLEAGTVHYRTDPTTQAGTETAPAASTDSAAESTTASE